MKIEFQSDYSEGCAAGREAAMRVLREVCADGSDNLPRLVWALREAAANAGNDDDGLAGHGVGFLYAVAAAAFGHEKT